MQVKSLVECLNSTWFCLNGDPIPSTNLPQKGIIYTVRGIREEGPYILILLEEIIMPIHPIGKVEWAFQMEQFREVQPPMTISIDELLQEPQLV